MPSLTEKLKDLGVQVGTSQIIPDKSNVIRRCDLLDTFQGGWESTRAGDCFVLRKDISLSTRHGTRKLKSIPSLSIFDSHPSLRVLSQIPLSRYLFIDTETTGLSGGAGTYVFLIGAAKFIGDKIHLAQFFLQDPSLESGLLSALDSFIANSQVIISYNGKSFDLPRIKTRYRFHGWPNPFEDVNHLDLLHLTRKLWKAHLPSCTLGEIEHSLLGLERDGLDIPGWKISDYFYDYLQSGDPEPLKSIFYHNEIDVLSLISLLEYIIDRLSSPLSKLYKNQDDLISIGNFLIYLRQPQKARKVLEHALKNKGLTSEFRMEGLLSLAQIYKKNNLYQLAYPLWLECANLESLEAQIELAKYYEHQLHDYQEAIHWTLSALEISDSTIPPSRPTSPGPLELRLIRLKSKATP